MNWLQFIDSMIGHLIWPAVVLVIAFAVRKHLGSLAERVLELSFGGATVKFGQLLSRGTDIIEESQGPPPPLPPPDESKLHLEKSAAEAAMTGGLWSANFDRFVEMTSSRTLSIRTVFAAFEETERVLNELGDALGIKARGVTLMEMLLRRGYVTKDLIVLYRSLRNARNAIAHGEADMPNEAESLEFVRQANFLQARLALALDAVRAGKSE
ncbi:hypothetical protein NLM33_35635 [Bradyrhizobium sp. CCGUVB1N3]|uniref:hypothetical protein n=1 Tax=Bradyrhizobium sp. CCGUVB1N3 TaxID=2949629 RepID=UPI0020B2833D|nr:hypothetical protein [Bradyrhizobium sp. CCGUVB1N3]MCP3475609.1 hypothetical protein [Bradyrhizobium sp. CCGUVB1N3]